MRTVERFFHRVCPLMSFQGPRWEKIPFTLWAVVRLLSCVCPLMWFQVPPLGKTSFTLGAVVRLRVYFFMFFHIFWWIKILSTLNALVRSLLCVCPLMSFQVPKQAKTLSTLRAVSSSFWFGHLWVWFPWSTIQAVTVRVCVWSLPCWRQTESLVKQRDLNETST
jgi:hypothetical protein